MGSSGLSRYPRLTPTRFGGFFFARVFAPGPYGLGFFFVCTFVHALLGNP